MSQVVRKEASSRSKENLSSVPFTESKRGPSGFLPHSSFRWTRFEALEDIIALGQSQCTVKGNSVEALAGSF